MKIPDLALFMLALPASPVVLVAIADMAGTCLPFALAVVVVLTANAIWWSWIFTRFRHLRFPKLPMP